MIAGAVEDFLLINSPKFCSKQYNETVKPSTPNECLSPVWNLRFSQSVDTTIVILVSLSRWTYIHIVVYFFKQISRFAPILPKKLTVVKMLFVMLTTMGKSTNQWAVTGSKDTSVPSSGCYMRHNPMFHISIMEIIDWAAPPVYRLYLSNYQAWEINWREKSVVCCRLIWMWL